MFLTESGGYVCMYVFEDSSDGSVVTQDTLMKKIDPCGSALFHGGDKR
jgi:hypothetical protein